MNLRVTGVLLSILAISHHVESKPGEASPDVSTKSDDAKNENPAPPNNGELGPNDVSTVSIPVGGAIKASDTNVNETASAALDPTSTSTGPTIATTVLPDKNTSSTNATSPSPTLQPTTQSSSSVAPTTTKTTAAPTAAPTTIPTMSTHSSKIDTTTLLPTPTPSKPSVTSQTPISETSTQSVTVKDRRFDGPSFIGGIVLSLGTMAIGFVAFKFYKARTERNYHTL